MKMKDLEARTGVNRETIRVYLREGLLPEPQRPKPNVAIYGEAHVRAIQAILDLQKGRRIPLRQIRRAMEGAPEAIPSDAGAFARLESLVAERVGADDALAPLAAVAAVNPRAEADAGALEAIGAVRLTRRGRKLFLTRTDAQLVALWGQMRAAGFDEAAGFDPKVAAMYVAAARSLAQAEVRTFLQIVGGRMGEERAAALAQTALSLMLDFFGHLRMKAVLEAFAEQTRGGPAGSTGA
jgi:DNA-binding transcriptional MerR regulator